MNDYNITSKIEKEVFKDRLIDLFDIAHLNALQIIKLTKTKNSY